MGILLEWLLEAVDWYGKWNDIKVTFLTLSAATGGVVTYIVAAVWDLSVWWRVVGVLFGVMFLPTILLCLSFFKSGPLRLVPDDGEIVQRNRIDDENALPFHQGNREAISITVKNFASINPIKYLNATITAIVPHPYNGKGDKLLLPQRLMLGNKEAAEKVTLDYNELVKVQLFSKADAFLANERLRIENSDKKSFIIEENKLYKITLLVAGLNIKPMELTVSVIRRNDKDFAFSVL